LDSLCQALADGEGNLESVPEEEPHLSDPENFPAGNDNLIPGNQERGMAGTKEGKYAEI